MFFCCSKSRKGIERLKTSVQGFVLEFFFFYRNYFVEKYKYKKEYWKKIKGWDGITLKTTLLYVFFEFLLYYFLI